MSEAIHYGEYVNYALLDAFGKQALRTFSSTWKNPNKSGIRLLEESIGETAQVFDIKFDDKIIRIAKNAEILGTKVAVAVEMARRNPVNTFKYFKAIGQDTANMSFNDVLAVGSQPFSYSSVITVGDSNFLKNGNIVGGILSGLEKAANDNQACIAGGETGTLKGIVLPEQADLSGCSLGRINPIERFVHGGNVMPGDVLYGVVVNTPCANGFTAIREVAEKLPQGYFTEMQSGELFGEAVLRPTPSFSPVINALFDAGVDIHYLQPITGHGFKKIARSRKKLTYVINNLPEIPEIFQFIQREQNIDDKELVETYNGGIGFMAYVAGEDKRVPTIVREHGMEIVKMGYVDKGPKRILVESLGIKYTKKDLAT